MSLPKAHRWNAAGPMDPKNVVEEAYIFVQPRMQSCGLGRYASSYNIRTACRAVQIDIEI